MIEIGSVEFYVIAATIAAAVIAYSALPSRGGAAIQHLLAGVLSNENPQTEPSIEIEVDDDRQVIIKRHGLQGITDTGAASLAVEIIGFNITIEERLTPGKGEHTFSTATFKLNTLAPERYHIRYNSESTSSFAALTLPVREGIHITRELK